MADGRASRRLIARCLGERRWRPSSPDRFQKVRSMLSAVLGSATRRSEPPPLAPAAHVLGMASPPAVAVARPVRGLPLRVGKRSLGRRVSNATVGRPLDCLGSHALVLRQAREQVEENPKADEDVGHGARSLPASPRDSPAPSRAWADYCCGKASCPAGGPSKAPWRPLRCPRSPGSSSLAIGRHARRWRASGPPESWARTGKPSAAAR